MHIKYPKMFWSGTVTLIGLILTYLYFYGGFNQTDLTFTSQGDQISATLYIPSGDGPFPVVIFTHYSGKQSRDAGKYIRRARYFARNGIAALIYDRRGRGESTGDPHRFIPFETLADTAVQAASLLKRRSDILGDFIGVAGRSQGGWVAPTAAAKSEDISFVMITAGNVITPDAQAIFMLENMVARLGTAFGLDAAGLAEHKALGPVERAILEEPEQAERMIEFLLFDAAPFWRQLDVPVFAAWGTADELTPAIINRDIISSLLSPSVRNSSTLIIFPGARHNLEETNVEEQMVEWVKALVSG